MTIVADRMPVASRSTLAAGAMAALAVALGAGAVAFLLVPVRPGVPGPNVSVFQAVSNAAFLMVTPILGAFVVHRRPGNVIGWLFIHLSLWLGLGFFVDGVARHAPPVPLVGVIAAAGSSLGSFGFVALVMLVELFPTGRLPSARWRVLPALAILGGTLQFLIGIVAVTPTRPGVPDLPTPLARPDLAGALDVIGVIGSIALLVALLGTVALTVLRFRRARGVERQQLKWFAWAASIVAILLTAGIVTSPLGAISDTMWSLALASLLLLPVASTIAILRHRLYDIDRIVSRTVSYGAVTGILALVFVGTILVSQTVLASFFSGNSVAVAASTLVVAALFQPLRRRVQSIVDRRFNRSRYDAERTVAAFGAHLRDEVDLGALRRDLVATVDQTLQPTRTGVWLRDRAKAVE